MLYLILALVSIALVIIYRAYRYREVTNTIARATANPFTPKHPLSYALVAYRWEPENIIGRCLVVRNGRCYIRACNRKGEAIYFRRSVKNVVEWKSNFVDNRYAS